MMKTACLFLVLSHALAEQAVQQGPREAAYWAQKRASLKGAKTPQYKNVIKNANSGIGLREKTKTGSATEMAANYWAQKAAARSGTMRLRDETWARKKNIFAKVDGSGNHGPGAENPYAKLRQQESDDYEPCPNGRIPMHVVSLQNRYDRWDRMSIRWNGMMLMHPEVCLDMGRFDATNGAKDPIPLKLVTKQWSTARNRKYVGNGTWYDKVDDTLELTPGERGCAASHVRLWKKVAKMDGPAILVEDDAIPVEGFATKLMQGLQDLPEDADLLYLGYSRPDSAPWIRELPGTDLAQAEYVWTTVGYMIWPSGARKLLQRLPVDSPVDNYMSWASHEGQTKVYAFKTPVIKQELPWNLASDVEHSDENSKNAKENMNAFHEHQDIKRSVSLVTRPFIAAQNSFHQFWTETMKSADDWLEEDASTQATKDTRSQSTKELEAIEREHAK